MSLALEETVIDIPLGRLQGLRGGRAGAPKVLALHGWLDNAASFVPLAAHIGDIELVALDLPGHGRSVHLPRGAHYTFELAVHHVLDAADALGWREFRLLGHSMGAGIASLIAASAPERIERLVCIEALGGLADAPEHTAQRMRESVTASRALGDKPLRVFDSIQPAIHARMRANQMSEPVARLIVERGIRKAAGGWEWSSDQRLTVPTFVRPVDAQIEDLVAGIECPTRVIFADPAQPYLADATRRRYAARLADGELFVLPGTHHLLWRFHVQVARIVGDFLAG